MCTQEDLEESVEVVIAGYQKKNAILTDKEKHIVAYREIGHALVAAKQSPFCTRSKKITIVPRTSGALGYTMQIDEGNHYLMSKEEMEDGDRDPDRRTGGRRNPVRLHHDGSVQRHRAGDPNWREP